MNSSFSRHILHLLLLVIPVFSGVTLFASTQPLIDSSKVVVRQPGQKIIDSYRSQKEFIYAPAPLETNFIKQLWNYIIAKIEDLISFSKAIPFIFKLLIWGLVIFFVFIIITQSQLYQLFYSDKVIESPNYTISKSDEEIVDYDDAIRQFKARQQFRSAIRMYYLKVIKALLAQGYIQFSKEKTNFDYLHDLTNDEMKSQFSAITSIYNHVWYGDVEINEVQFLRLAQSFQSFYTTIDAQK
ncbi:MAG: hypothetical protein WCP85_05245 [Mariniphaga sp.]